MADKYVLLVEGPDDAHVIKNLCSHHQIIFKYQKRDTGSPYAIKIQDTEGVNELLENLGVRINAGRNTGLEHLGIVVDADMSITDRWTALRNRLIEHGYDKKRVPKVPDPAGTIIKQDGEPVVGIWLMPNNTLPGMLEDFIRFLVPPNDSLWERAGECIDGIPEKDQLFDHLIQAHVHTWLAWQKEPGKPLGLAITFRYLDPTTTRATIHRLGPALIRSLGEASQCPQHTRN